MSRLKRVDLAHEPQQESHSGVDCVPLQRRLHHEHERRTDRAVDEGKPHTKAVNVNQARSESYSAAARHSRPRGSASLSDSSWVM